MMLIKTKLKESAVHGVGIFADQPVPKGTDIWRFTPGFDQKFTREQMLGFPDLLQIYLYTYTWRSKKTGLYCFAADNGKHINHSTTPNTRSEYRDEEDEVVIVTLRDIESGEELFEDYSYFEDVSSEGNVLEEIAAKFNLVDELDPRLKPDAK